MTKKQRRAYHDFRKMLVEDGFLMLQLSVYARSCPSMENAEVHAKRIKKAVPPKGQVRLLLLTDKQYARMQIFQGKTREAPEKPPEQLSFF